MENAVKNYVFTQLHVVFVNDDRRIIREIHSECVLTRSGIPEITINDEVLLNIFDRISNYYIEYNHDDDHITLPFYDVEMDRFIFTTSNISDISKHPEKDPDKIRIELLEVKDWDGNVATLLLLEPGLWKHDDEGRYRVSDDSMMHVIMDTKISPLINDGSISFEDGAAMTLYCFINNSLVLDIDPSHNDEDNDDYEDDDDEIVNEDIVSPKSKLKMIKIKRCNKRNCRHRKF